MIKNKKVTPKRASKVSPSEVGVCGTGRSRVININPLLLTPSSASKLHTVDAKKRRSRKKGPVKLEIESQLHQQNTSDTQFDTDTSQSTLPTYFDSTSNVFHSRQLSNSLSVTGSELSISSALTTDDVSSIADSEITDVSESGANVTRDNGYLSDTTLQASPPLNSTLYTDLHSPQRYNDEVVFHSTLPDVGGLSGTGSQHDGQILPRKQEVKRKARLERTIEISPTLMLPVTSVGGDHKMPRKDESFAFDITVPKERTATNRMIDESLQIWAGQNNEPDVSVPVSESESIRADTENEDSMVESTAESSLMESDVMQKLQSDCDNLRQSLKLADADIAILVTSKQQLQLQFQEEKEKKAVISKSLHAAEEAQLESKQMIQNLGKALKEKEEAHERTLTDHAEEIKKITDNLEAAHEMLDITRAERDTTRTDTGNLIESVGSYQSQIKQMQRELENATSTNIRLEELLQEASCKGEGKETFISHLKQERNDLAKKSQELEQMNALLEIKNKSQESKIVDLQHVNEEHSAKLSKLEARAKEAEADRSSLSNKLKFATSEKTQLNAAVARLHTDLSMVEVSFSRLKKQMIEKTKLAENETARRMGLEREVQVLAHQLEKLNNLDAETKIRDKNVQIEQLLTKSRISTSEKSRLEKTIERLQTQLATAEKSWADAVQREKQISRSLSEREQFCSEKERQNEELSGKLVSKAKEFDNVKEALDASKSSEFETNTKLQAAEKRIEDLLKESRSTSEAMEQMRRQLHEKGVKSLEDDARHKNKIARLQSDVLKLNTQVETLQLSLLSKEEELKTRNVAQTGSHEPDSHSVQQMQMLSELQSARRILSQEKDALSGENADLRSEIRRLSAETEALNFRLSEAKSNELEVNGLVKELETSKREMENELTAQKQRLKETEVSKMHLAEEISVIREHNNSLSQQLGSLQTHNQKLSEDLRLKIMELEESVPQKIRMQEEMNILKQELANVTLQLSEALQANSQLGGTGDMENVIKERDMLKDAVIRQQQYVASLQKHYENWARDASANMKEEVSKIRVAAEQEITRLQTEKMEHESLLRKMEEKISESGLAADHRSFTDAATQSDPQQKSGSSLKDSHTQTEHSSEPVIPWSQKFDEGLLLKEEMVALKNSLEAKVSDALKKNEDLSQTDTETLASEHYVLKEALVRQQKYTASLQNHYEKWAREAGDRMKQEISTIRTATDKEKLLMKAENCSLVEVIATLQEKIEELGMRNSNTAEGYTQTDHDDVSIHGQCEIHKTEQVCLEDSATQTEHDAEGVAVSSKEIVDQSEIHVERANLKARVVELETLLQKTQVCEDESSTNASTQTSHDEDVLPVDPAFLPPVEVSLALLEDASTQTSHEDEPLHTQDTSNSVEKLNRLRAVEEEKSQLLKENIELKNLISALEKSSTDLNAQKELTESYTQTSKDHEEIGIFQSNAFEEASTQTEHDEEPMSPLPSVPNELSKEMSLRVIAEEERDLLKEEYKQMGRKLSTMEERLSAFTTECEKIDSSTQTSHDDAPLHMTHQNFTLKPSNPSDDSSTQTDHEFEPYQEAANKSQFTVHERESMINKLEELAKRNYELEKLIQNTIPKPERVDANTQTTHDDMPLPTSSDAQQLKAFEDAWTQYEHNDLPIVPWSQEANSKIQEELRMVRELAEDEIQRLVNEKAIHVEEIAILKSKLREYMIPRVESLDMGVQTNHEEMQLDSSYHVDQHSIERTNGWSQTSHDLEHVTPTIQVSKLKQLEEELAMSKQELANVYSTLSDAHKENEDLNHRLKGSDFSYAQASTQTSHDDDPICLHAGLRESGSIPTSNGSTQTDELSWGQAVPPTCNHATNQTEHQPLICQNCSKVVAMDKTVIISEMASQPQSKASDDTMLASTIERSGFSESKEDGSCPHCGLKKAVASQDFLLPPSPMTILKTMESRKLKAYKKTVHLLKKKLETAENQVKDLQAEIKMLTPSTHVQFVEDENTEVRKSGDDPELFEQNRKAMAEIKQLQNEIFEAKKSSALQAEDRRRKALAERKKLEAKIANMSERICALTETNKRLRDSVEKLQVRLSERTKESDMAQKEKQRYQLRARRLQASLRSLAWITGNQNETITGNGSETLNEDSSVLEDSLEADVIDKSKGDSAEIKSNPNRSVLSLPASVTEIEESLRDLQSEIIALERQMQEHNSAVKKSKSQWTKLKEESHQNLSFMKEEEDNVNSYDHIDMISQVI